jgi:outer membrane protein OmpA-like peptidoglycan-associated protein
MTHHLYRSAAIAVLVVAGTLAGPAMITRGFAQEAQTEAPPIPMDKVNKVRCKGKNKADCAAKQAENAAEETEKAAGEVSKEAEGAAKQVEEKAGKAEKRAKKEAEKEAQKAEREAKRAEEEARQAEEKAKRAVEQEAEKAQSEAERAGKEVEQAVEGKKRKQAGEAQQQVQEPAAAQSAEQPATEDKEPPVEQAAEPQQPKAGQAEQATEGGKDRRKRREAAESAPVAEPEMTVDEARKELETPATVSPEAEKPKDVAAGSIQKQLQNAEEKQTAVIPDQLTKKQRDEFVHAEKKRREHARNDRGTLLGAAAVGAVIGAIIPQLGGRVEVDQGDRLVVYRDGEYYVRRDESALLRGGNVRVEYERMGNGLVREIVTRRDGTQIVTVKDPGGYMLRRVKVLPNGTRIVLFDFHDDRGYQWRPLYDIPRYSVDIPRDRYIVSARRADRRLFRDTFRAPPVYVPEQRYTLAQIREYEPVRAMVRRVDLDTINFAFGSAFVEASQVALLGDIAGGMLDVIYEEPETVFLIEGHTDAVGSEVDNLLLSDRRAEAVARILVEAYGVPPENLVSQGYGEQYLKVDTGGPEQANRRATVRNITPILDASAN